MRQLKIGKEIDEYMSVRNRQKRVGLVESVRKKFSGFNTGTSHEKSALDICEPTRVTIVAPKPNFFRVLHDKVMSFFRGH